MLKNIKIKTKLSLMVLIPLLSVLVLSIEGIVNIDKNTQLLTSTYYEGVYKISVLLSDSNNELLNAKMLQDEISQNTVNSEAVNNKQLLKNSLEKVKTQSKEANDKLLPLKSVYQRRTTKDTKKNIYELYSDFETNYNLWLDTFDQNTGA
jgi:methyl-accepting chemotaxis protein